MLFEKIGLWVMRLSLILISYHKQMGSLKNTSEIISLRAAHLCFLGSGVGGKSLPTNLNLAGDVRFYSI